MPTYSFLNESGEKLELLFSMSEAPALGECIEHEGQLLTRILDAPNVRAKPEVRFTSQRFGAWEGYDKNGKDLAPSRDAEGLPQFTSARQAEEFAAKWNQTNPSSTVTWDPD